MPDERWTAAPVGDVRRPVGRECEVVGRTVDVGVDGGDTAARPALEPRVAAVEDDDRTVGRDVERRRADLQAAWWPVERDLADVRAPRRVDDAGAGLARSAEA